jgi:hypothetical protein
LVLDVYHTVLDGQYLDVGRAPDDITARVRRVILEASVDERAEIFTVSTIRLVHIQEPQTSRSAEFIHNGLFHVGSQPQS